jgi:hypothetical protein
MREKMEPHHISSPATGKDWILMGHCYTQTIRNHQRKASWK